MAVHLLLENKTNRKMEYDGSPPTTCGDDGGEEDGRLQAKEVRGCLSARGLRVVA